MKIGTAQTFIDKSIYYYTRRSLYIHLGIFISVCAYSFLFIGKAIWSTKVSVVETAVRVDVVAMPKYTIAELKAFEEQSASFDLENGVDEELAKVEDPEQQAFLVKKKKEDFASMLKQLSAKKVGKKKIKNKSTLKKEVISAKMKQELQNLVVAGNKLSQGTALTGGQTSGEMTEFSKYITSLPAWVRPKWKLPSYLLREELKCRVRIFLKPNGELIKAAIFETSSNAEYDQRALQAVYDSAPFPEVPGQVAGRASAGEIVLGFPL